MSVCHVCGGSMRTAEHPNIIECEYCGVRKNVLLRESEEIIGLKKIAGEAYRQMRYEEAASLYNQLLALSEDDPEVYWLLTLCTYGVHFVEFPGTGKRIPTLHHTLTRPIRTDYNYQNALNTADAFTAESYKKIAEQIARLNGEINRLSSECSYDVMIITPPAEAFPKEHINGSRLFEKLHSEGVSVFFAPESLKGTEPLEAEILTYTALHSAKITFCISFSADGFAQPYTQHTYRRYLDIRAKKAECRFITYCASTDIPGELMKLQFINAADEGISSLVNRALKILHGDAPADTDVLKTRLTDLLKYGAWEDVIKLCTQSLKENDHLGFVYAIRLAASLKAPSIKALSEVETDFSENEDYLAALRTLNKKDAAELQEYHDEALYRMAKKASLSKDTVHKAYLIFIKIRGYRDADELARQLSNAYIRENKPLAQQLMQKGKEDIPSLLQALDILRKLQSMDDVSAMLNNCSNTLYIWATNALADAANNWNAATVKLAKDSFLALSPYKEAEEKALLAQKMLHAEPLYQKKAALQDQLDHSIRLDISSKCTGMLIKTAAVVLFTVFLICGIIHQLAILDCMKEISGGILSYAWAYVKAIISATLSPLVLVLDFSAFMSNLPIILATIMIFVIPAILSGKLLDEFSIYASMAGIVFSLPGCIVVIIIFICKFREFYSIEVCSESDTPELQLSLQKLENEIRQALL